MKSAQIAPDATIGEYGYIGINVRIFPGVTIGSYVIICDDLDILPGCVIKDNIIVIDVPDTTDLVEILSDLESIADVDKKLLQLKVDAIPQTDTE